MTNETIIIAIVAVAFYVMGFLGGKIHEYLKNKKI